MPRGKATPTRVEACVQGRWTESMGYSTYRHVNFYASALVFDNRWIELENPILYVSYHETGRSTPLEHNEDVRGWYRVPIHRIERLAYDLCTTSE